MKTTTAALRLLSTFAPWCCAAAFQATTPRIFSALQRHQLSFTTPPMTVRRFQDDKQEHNLHVEELRRDWIHKSISYYSKVMREERRRNLGQIEGYRDAEYQENFAALAGRHYFALRKIKDGKLEHAELIYRRTIDQLMEDDNNDKEECTHAKLAVTTLLLALLLQRMEASPKSIRSVFLSFFRIVVSTEEQEQCACSAKVVGAFALFEMKQGNTLKSLLLAQRALELDPTVMHPLLQWKQFRDAAEQKEQRHNNQQSLPDNL